MNRVNNVYFLSYYRKQRLHGSGNLAVKTAEILRIGAIIIAAGLSISSQAHSTEGPEWVSSRMVSKEGPRGTIRARSFQRWITVERTSYSIGTVSYLDMPMQAAEFARIPEILKEGMGLKRWEYQRVYRGARAYEALWPAANRVIRLYTRHRAGRAEISIAVFRSAYADSMVFETEALQRGVLGILNGSRPWIERAISRAYTAMVPAAHAECGPCAPSDIACLLAQLNCNSAEMLDKIDGFTEVTADLVGEAATFNLTLAEIGGEVDSNWQETNKQLEIFNGHLAKANKTAERLVDFLTSPVAAFVSGAAGTLGSMGVNLAVEGLTLAGKELMDLITGASKEEEIRQRFALAREKWEQANQAAAELERMLDGLIALKGAAEKFQLTRESLVKVGPLLVRLDTAAQVSRAKLAQEMSKPNPNQSCIEQLSTSVAGLESLAANLRSVNTSLENAPGMPGEKQYCDSLNTLLDKLVMAEGEIQSFRTAIVDGRAQILWLKDWQDDEKDLLKADKKMHAKARKVRNERINHLDGRLHGTIASEKAKKGRWIHKCELDRKGTPEAWSQTELRQTCERLFAESDLGKESAKRLADEQSRHDAGVTAAEQTYETASRLPEDQGGLLWVHDLARDSYMKWMESLMTEQSQVATRVQELDSKKARIDQICAL